jgi:hypothetical protein
VLPGETEELRAGRRRLLGLAWFDDGARSDEDLGDFTGDALDGGQRHRCPQRQLDDWKTSGTNARAIGTAWSSSSTTTTEMTGTWLSSDGSLISPRS